ncbi:MAG: GDP-L-fucose synthase [Chloroflexi bacterium]|nr:GDP-L-fucose synthase [Chloroflexota bacterium]
MSRPAEKRIVVTGGAGFLGSHLVEALARRGCRDIFVPRSAQYDLTEKSDVRRMYEDARPQVVLHAAAKVGGIGYIKERPAEFLYENLMMGMLVMEEARRRGVEKLVAVGSVCAYPKLAPVPMREEDLWDGYPEETNAPYGLAKKMLLVKAQADRQQYGFNAVCLLLANLYGPRDNFDPRSCHVIPALVRRCLEAAEQGHGHIDAWGSGLASRDFLYVEDAAEAVVLAAERYDSSEPVNVGSGREITIRELAEIIARLTGFRGEVRWDASLPDGQPRRRLDTSRAERELGFRPATSFEEGLRRTIDWYRAEEPRVGGKEAMAHERSH